MLSDNVSSMVDSLAKVDLTPLLLPSVSTWNLDGSAVDAERVWSYSSMIFWPSADDEADKNVGPVVERL